MNNLPYAQFIICDSDSTETWMCYKCWNNDTRLLLEITLIPIPINTVVVCECCKDKHDKYNH